MTDKRTAKKSLDFLGRGCMLHKKDDAETLTSDHRLLRDVPSFKPNAYTPKRAIKRQSRWDRMLESNKLKE
jgi:hypothetical protein